MLFEYSRLHRVGRKKIYTSVKQIDRNNLLAVIEKADKIHSENRDDINFLFDYEAGKQPLQREKKIRPEINIEVTDNMANYIKEFNIGYFWANPIMLIQHGNQDAHKTDAGADDKGIAALNEMLMNGESMAAKDQEIGNSVEICGIGHKLIDIRTEFDGYSYVHVYPLDSRNAYCVYANDVTQRKMLGVTYFIDDENKKSYTCYTDEYRFDIDTEKHITVTRNLLGMIPIVEYIRTFDRTGCFERYISEMDALNILQSDYTNGVAQRTQEIWWGNDIDFDVDENGNYKTPQSGQWLLTSTGDSGTNPKVQPLTNKSDDASTLSAISNQRTWILQMCKVPLQYDNSGGGSTGTATDMAAGWAAASLEASRKEQLVEKSKREELRLILKAISLVSANALPMNDPIRKVHLSDVDFHFTRRKSYDLSIKANTYATLVSHGIQGRHALKVVDMFEDTEQTYLDSEELINKYQESTFSIAEQSDDETNNSSDDTANQTENSPILDKTT